MADSPELIPSILDLDILLQRQVYAGWPASWVEVKWPVGAIRALLVIERGFARCPGEVADVLKVSRTSVTGMLDRLEADGLMTRTIDAHDRRSFTLELTASGRDLARQIDDLRRQPIERALRAMAPADVRALHRGLSALTQAMHTRREKSGDEPRGADDSG
ncbi:MAG TPA: MarR family transcriptional regulator [Aggregatilineales bacterium]|nr:MarR family transcriptional regulator [Aggregatilineales bacterium]